MNVYGFAVQPIGANSYILENENDKNVVIIDLGGSVSVIDAFINEKQFNPLAVLLTHGHFDHSTGAEEYHKRGIPVYVSEFDAEMLETDKNMASDYGLKYNYYKPDRTFRGGETLNIGNFQISVIATPGHTKGSVTFLTDKKLFTGDTLFRKNYGRCDFAGGSYKEIYNSIVNILFKLDGDYDVYPGHGEKTTLDTERRLNEIIY